MRRSLLIPALAAALAIAPAAHAAETVLAVEQQPTTVASWDTNYAWSSYDAASKTYKLVTWQNGQKVALPVAPSPRAFDVDLGTNRNGSPYAVYTRDGDIYRFGLKTGREEKVTKLSAPDAAESQPTIWSGRIAFVRREGRGWSLRYGDTTSGSKGSKLVTKIDAKDGSITAPQLTQGRVAYTVVKGSRRSIHVRTLSTGTAKSIYTASSGGANDAEVTRPAWAQNGSFLYFARTNVGSGTGNRIVRWSLSTGKLSYAQGSPRILAVDVADPAAGFVVAEGFDAGGCLRNIYDPPDKSVCRVLTTGAVTFDANAG